MHLLRAEVPPADTEVRTVTLLLPAPAPAGLLAAADDDLDAVADRLHDGALQALVFARYACDAVARGADPALARDAVQEALVALRGEVWQLRPRGGQGSVGALAEALADLSAQLVSAGGAGLRLRLAAVRLAPAAAAAAYRLVQELARPRTGPLDVRLSADGVLDVDAPLTDPTAWLLRAAALGGGLVASTSTTRLQLPTDEDPS